MVFLKKEYRKRDLFKKKEGEVSPSLQPPAVFSATPSNGGYPRNAQHHQLKTKKKVLDYNRIY